jgi:serine/threonine-protein kinase HipA
MTRSLNVYLHDRKTGVLTQDDAGQLRFAYSEAYLGAKGAARISWSMPLTDQPYDDRIVRPYFAGLLPDEGARRKLAGALGVSEGNAFGLLEIIGGECAGALSLYTEGQTPPDQGPAGIEILDTDRLALIVKELRRRPLLGGEEGVRLSLAGAQEKLAVCVEGERIALALGGRPTTHILKPFVEALDGTVQNELFCTRLAARMGFAAPDVSMQFAGEIPFLLIERYDRKRQPNGTITRLHQEDFCQALSVPPELKYEDEGGPGTERSLSLIAEATGRPAADRLTFIRMLAFNYLVGNADAHAKNFALLYTDPVPDLAPLYDVVCTAAYKPLAKRLAMAIGGRNVPDTIQLAHWLSLVPDTRGAQRLLIRDLGAMAGDITKAADVLLAELKYENTSHPILTDVRRVIDSRARLLLKAIESANA